jgi:hypothetical protein
MKRIVLFVGVAVFGLVGIARGADEKRPEPRYEGKSLAYWEERLLKCEKSDDQRHAAEAIVAFGPDAKVAVPRLVELLDDRSAVFRRLVGDILYALGPDAKEAVPVLLRSLTKKTARSPEVVMKILSGLGTDAKEALPEFKKGVQDKLPQTRLYAAIGLWKVEKSPRVVVPVLTELLDKREEIVTAAAKALGEIGPEAHAALPKMRFITENGLGVESFLAIAEAIRKIDPEGAKKVKAGRSDLPPGLMPVPPYRPGEVPTLPGPNAP